jgi:hypothetical protein
MAAWRVGAYSTAACCCWLSEVDLLQFVLLGRGHWRLPHWVQLYMYRIGGARRSGDVLVWR